jgi:hypothetical protein
MDINLREYFAAAALKGMLSFSSNDPEISWGDDPDYIAEHAYIYAGAMMKEFFRLEDAAYKKEEDIRKKKNMQKWEPILSALQSPMLASDWYNAMKDWGLPRATFFRYLEDMKDAGLVKMNPADNKYQRTETK